MPTAGIARSFCPMVTWTLRLAGARLAGTAVVRTATGTGTDGRWQLDPRAIDRGLRPSWSARTAQRPATSCSPPGARGSGGSGRSPTASRWCARCSRGSRSSTSGARRATDAPTGCTGSSSRPPPRPSASTSTPAPSRRCWPRGMTCSWPMHRTSISAVRSTWSSQGRSSSISTTCTASSPVSAGTWAPGAGWSSPPRTCSTSAGSCTGSAATGRSTRSTPAGTAALTGGGVARRVGPPGVPPPL